MTKEESNQAKLEVIKKMTAASQKRQEIIDKQQEAINRVLDLLGDGQGLDKQDAIYDVIDILSPFRRS